jgi:hypothetical protein
VISPPDKNGVRWANKCDLCSSSRKNIVGDECAWCCAVRMKHGNYWYPIDDTNKHLFPPAPKPALLSCNKCCEKAVMPDLVCPDCRKLWLRHPITLYLDAFDEHDICDAWMGLPIEFFNPGPDFGYV